MAVEEEVEEEASSTSLFIFAFGCNQTICSTFVVDDDDVDDALDVTPLAFITHYDFSRRDGDSRFCTFAHPIPLISKVAPIS